MLSKQKTLHFLIIQTAFIGDVILATPVIEKLHQFFPGAKIDFLLRKGNESLLEHHPYINEIIMWDKKQNKSKNLWQIGKKIRQFNYDYVINLHRFASSGLITAFSRAKHRIGFDKNPLSFLYSKIIKHEIGNGKHEVQRNLDLVKELTDDKLTHPKLYPTIEHFKNVQFYKYRGDTTPAFEYICIAPTSVWFTKQLPKEKWITLINQLPEDYFIYLLGASSDKETCEEIRISSKHSMVENLAGKLSFLDSAALMRDAKMNYVNDSAPMHLASAMNAPTTAVFCSTIPAFGFSPLAAYSKTIETQLQLDCRPCGLHGFKSCPKGHFKCATTIKIDHLTATLSN